MHLLWYKLFINGAFWGHFATKEQALSDAKPHFLNGATISLIEVWEKEAELLTAEDFNNL